MNMDNEQDTFLSQNLTNFPLNQYRFLWFLFAADCLYPIFAITERVMLGTYPPKRFYQKKMIIAAVWAHIVSGSTILFTGMVTLAVGEVDSNNGGDWYYYIAGVCGLVHCCTGLYMMPTVHGEKTITQPLYFSQITMNALDAVTLLRFPTFDHMMFLWGAINAFMMVRLLLFSLVLFPWIDNTLLYTYAVVASFISPLLTGHDALWLGAYGLPAIYAPFVYWFGYRHEQRELGSTVRDPSFSDGAPGGGRSSSFWGGKQSYAFVEPDVSDVKAVQISTSGVTFDILPTTTTRPSGTSFSTGVRPRKSVAQRAQSTFKRRLTVQNDSRPFEGHPFFRTNDDVVHSHTSLHTLILGGLLMAAIVALLSTLDVENDTAGEDCNNLINGGGVPDFLSIPNAREPNEIARNFEAIRPQEIAGGRVAYQFKPRQVPTFDGGVQDLYGGPGGQLGTLQAELEYNTFLLSVLAPHQGGVAEPEFNTTFAAVLSAANPTQLADVSSSLFEPPNSQATFGRKFPVPISGAEATLNDEAFADNLLTFTPLFIQRTFSLPQRFSTLNSADIPATAIGTLTLNEALSRGLVYNVDLEYYGLIGDVAADAVHASPNHITRNTKYNVGVHGLFVVNPSTRKLMPAAIWLGGDSNTIFTPSGSREAWIVAKLFFAHASKMVSHLDHLTLCHFYQEPFMIAARRQMSLQHPIRALLEHHGYLGTGIVEFVAREFFVPNANREAQSPDLILGPGAVGLAKLMARSYQEYNYARQHPRDDFKRRDVMDLPNYVYRDDTLALYDQLEWFLARVINNYYQKDSDVASDYELQNMAQDISSSSLGRMPGFPDRIVSKSELLDVITRYVWRSTAFHAAVSGENAYDYLGHPLAWPAALYAPPPKKGDVITESQIISKWLPTREQTAYKLAILRLFKRGLRPQDSIFYTYDNALVGSQVWLQRFEFQQRLANLRERVLKRRANHRGPAPFYGLDPINIPYWTWL